MLAFYLMMFETEQDKQKFEEIYQANQQMMYHTANKILHHPQQAEDAVHQAFLKLIEIWGTVKEQSCPQIASLSVIISRNTAIDLARKNKYRAYVPLEERLDLEAVSRTDEEALGNISAAVILEKAKELPDIYRDVMMLYLGNDLSIPQISKALKISNVTAQKRIQRGRARLAACLKEEVAFCAG